jgi:hypothetical protein
MRALTCAVIVLSCVGLALLGCTDKSQSVVAPTEQAAQVPASLAKVTLIPFTATEMATGYVPGKLVGNGNRTVYKGVVFYLDHWTNITGPADLLNGPVVYTFDASFNALGEGPMQGKFTMTVGGGTWEGTVEGKMFMASDGSELQGAFNYVAQGKGGSIDGMKLSCSESYHEALDYSYSYGDLDGYIKSH